MLRAHGRQIGSRRQSKQPVKANQVDRKPPAEQAASATQPTTSVQTAMSSSKYLRKPKKKHQHTHSSSAARMRQLEFALEKADRPPTYPLIISPPIPVRMLGLFDKPASNVGGANVDDVGSKISRTRANEKPRPTVTQGY